jgi:hypothetical protein
LSVGDEGTSGLSGEKGGLEPVVSSSLQLYALLVAERPLAILVCHGAKQCEHCVDVGRLQMSGQP